MTWGAGLRRGLTRTGVPVTFRADMPLMQVQPLPRAILAAGGQNDVPIAEGMPGEVWADMAATLAAAPAPGRYAADARRRGRACPAGALPGVAVGA